MPFRIIKVLPGETDTYTKKEKLREGKEPLTEKEVRSSVNIFYGTNDKDLAIGYIYKLTPSFLSNGDPDGFTCKIECKQTKKKIDGAYCKNRFDARCYANFNDPAVFDVSKWEITAPPKNPHLRL